MAKLVLLVLCATGALARHLLDGNSYTVPSSDAQVRRNPETTMERRIEYGSSVNLNGHGVHIDPIHTHNSRTNRHSTPEIQYKINNQNRGTIGDVGVNNMVINNEYELKTNAYTSDSYYTTENVIDYNTYTNVNVEMHKLRKNAHLVQGNYPSETTTLKEPKINMYDMNGQEIGVLKTNKNSYTNLNQHTKENTDVTPNTQIQNNFMNQEAIVNSNMNTPSGRRIEGTSMNRPEGTLAKRPSSNSTKAISNSAKSNTDNGMPGQLDEDEIRWVWGTPNDTSTEKGELLDRAAFNGDKCPSDKVKASNGMCVDKH